MAKKGKYDKQHQVNLTKYERQVDLLYQQAINEAVQLGVSLGDFDHSKPFSFGDYPLVEKKADKLVRWLHDGLTSTISKGISAEWALSNKKNDAMAKYMLGKGKDELPAIIARKYYNHNGDAEKAFIARKAGGLKLSDRVWRYSDQFKNEIELGLDLGIRSGRSAADISRDIRLYLQQPDRLFRRVKTDMLDDDGKPIWRLSKAAQMYHPGRGMYRSSYKNARRLAATETNIAYRTADHTRWQQMDFVLGQHVLLSNNHTLNGHRFIDMCDELSGKDEHDKKGRYPKDFKFTGWHVLCRCFVVPILVDEDEMDKYNNAIANGERYRFSGQIKDVTPEFTQWVEDNSTRIKAAGQRGTLPYFIRDNAKYFPKDIMPKDLQKVKLTPKEIAVKRHAARSPEHIADIKRRAAERQERLKEAHRQEVLTQAKARQAARTPEQIADIKRRAEERQQRLNGVLATTADDKKLSEALGITKGKPMTFEEANALRGNPHYSEGVEYRVNCQSAVVANELRRRGWDVEAFGNIQKRNTIPHALSKRPEAAWIDANGKIPESKHITASGGVVKYHDKNGVLRVRKRPKTMSFSEWKNNVEDAMKEEGRYHVHFTWDSSNGSHIVTCERLKDGTLRWYDPQNGKVTKGLTWMQEAYKTDGMHILRVDNLRPNINVVGGVVKPLGSTLTTSLMSNKQLEFWRKALTPAQQRRVITGNNSDEPLRAAKDAARRDKERLMPIKEDSQYSNLQTGVMRRANKARSNILWHTYEVEQVEAGVYIWNHPEKLKFVRASPMGEVKNMSNELDKKNIEGKESRGFTHFNIYKFTYKEKEYLIKTIANRRREQLYTFYKEQ